MKKHELTEWGNPILAKKLKAVSLAKIKSPSFQRFVDDMIFMLKDRGVGISANQLGKDFRVFVSWVQPTRLRPQLVDEGPTVMINPSILKFSKKEKKWEGCMSLPGPMGMVPRANKIKVSYLDRKGQKIIQDLDGLKAHIFQHEIDHLDGIVYTERMLTPVRLVSTKEYLKRIKK